jgi:hypothetical protein
MCGPWMCLARRRATRDVRICCFIDGCGSGGSEEEWAFLCVTFLWNDIALSQLMVEMLNGHSYVLFNLPKI